MTQTLHKFPLPQGDAVARAVEIGTLPAAGLSMPTQVIERPVSLAAQWRDLLLGAARPARG